ncbi:hypothetical protein ACFWPV_06965 [Streptomyces uncialis]|uniref:hypothetical protein n=1 Tax=Streptomyces uncialis TaxID=1048205 RepID=UPI00366A06CE
MTSDDATTAARDDGADRQPPWAGPGPRGGVPWATPTAARRPGDRPTQRRRRVVEGLPDWEPTPPGEILLRRPGTGEGT